MGRADIGGIDEKPIKPGVGVSDVAVAMQKAPAEALVPNTVRFDASVATRVSDGKLVAVLSICLRPCQCSDDGVWKDIYIEAPATFSVADIEQCASENPALAEPLKSFWSAMNDLVDAINAQQGLV